MARGTSGLVIAIPRLCPSLGCEGERREGKPEVSGSPAWVVQAAPSEAVTCPDVLRPRVALQGESLGNGYSAVSRVLLGFSLANPARG